MIERRSEIRCRLDDDARRPARFTEGICESCRPWAIAADEFPPGYELKSESSVNSSVSFSYCRPLQAGPLRASAS